MTSFDVLATPIWRAEPTGDEVWNVGRTIGAMPDTDHVFLAPRSLDTGRYRRLFPASRVVRGPDTAFAGVWQYSRAMLDARLYRAFARYRFLVVAQTDAFLVRSLAEHLDIADWDYAGAPFADRYEMSLLTAYSRKAGELERRLRRRTVVRIGNGGLSVRRVAAFTRLLRPRPLLARAARSNEDLVIGWYGERGALRLAPHTIADRLFFDSQERDPSSGEPFGFHALQKRHPDHYAALRTGA